LIIIVYYNHHYSAHSNDLWRKKRNLSYSGKIIVQFSREVAPSNKIVVAGDIFWSPKTMALCCAISSAKVYGGSRHWQRIIVADSWFQRAQGGRHSRFRLMGYFFFIFVMSFSSLLFLSCSVARAVFPQ
jgi:hypothetical protein